jgi:hypothetical protein
MVSERRLSAPTTSDPWYLRHTVRSEKYADFAAVFAASLAIGSPFRWVRRGILRQN